MKHLNPGQRFSRWEVLAKASPAKNGAARWLCRCDCGAERAVLGISLRTGVSRSCGCLHWEERVEDMKAIATKHGYHKLPEYRTYLAMIRRCYGRRTDHSQYYQDRGITICMRWLGSFEHFMNDVGQRPSPKHSLDRYPNNNGNYEPGNVRWATASEQMNNTRRNHVISANGQALTVAQWSAKCGIHRGTIVSRIQRLGWTPEMAVSTPVVTREVTHR